jgi:hypothetical protein
VITSRVLQLAVTQAAHSHLEERLDAEEGLINSSHLLKKSRQMEIISK